MEELVKFFYSRERRAWQMDEANRLQGKTPKYWIESEEWLTAFKNTLSKKKLSEFDKEWAKLEKKVEDWHNLPAKQQMAQPSPLSFT